MLLVDKNKTPHVFIAGVLNKTEFFSRIMKFREKTLFFISKTVRLNKKLYRDERANQGGIIPDSYCYNAITLSDIFYIVLVLAFL